MLFAFGSGKLVATPTGVANPTPRDFGILQDCSIDFDAPVKELVGTYQFPVAVARGKGKIMGKAKFASIDLGVYNDLFYGGTITTGETLMAANESHAIPTTPYQVTIAPPSAGVFVADQGVFDASLGKFMSNVTTPSAADQYSVNASTGVYTFYSADTAKTVYISYTYSVAASGRTMVMTNNLLGVQPTFSIILSQPYNSGALVLKLNQCIASKMGFATKLEDFQIPDFGFSAFADAANNIGTISTTL
jgi:hypothetical protein